MSSAPMSYTEEEGEEEDVTTSSVDDVDLGEPQSPHKLFLLGYIPHARHNPTLKSITNDLLSHYFISCNASKWTDSTGEPSRSRALLSNADALLFFINEQTLRDSNCLLTLQYAWNLTLPVLMLRPPMTKLVISNRDSLREREKIEQIGDGAIMKSGEPWQLLNGSNSDVIDFNLLQDILYEGYRLSTLYDVSSHSKSMCRLIRKLSTIFAAFPKKASSSTSSQPHFYLSPSNSSLYDNKFGPTSSDRRRRHKSSDNNNRMRLNMSSSTGNLNRIVRTPYPISKSFQFAAPQTAPDSDDDNEDMTSIKTRSGRTRHPMKSPPPPDRIPSSVGVSEGEVDDLPPPPPCVMKNIFKTPTLDLPTVETDSEIDADLFQIPPPTPITPGSGLFSMPSGRNTSSTARSRQRRQNFGSVTSRTSSLDRRMSMSCLEDMSNYQKTQYLVFPLRDSTKKPYLVKFPEDMAEEEEKHGNSVWGSDTSLEEEIKLAGRINAGIVIDYLDDSPILSPAPYLGDLN